MVRPIALKIGPHSSALLVSASDTCASHAEPLAGVHLERLRQQLPLLPRPAPHLLGVVVDVLRAFSWARPFRARRHPRRRMRPPLVAHSPSLLIPSFTPSFHTPFAHPFRRPAGAVASRFPWKPLGTPWSPSRLPPTPRWPSRSAPLRRARQKVWEGSGDRRLCRGRCQAPPPRSPRTWSSLSQAAVRTKKTKKTKKTKREDRAPGRSLVKPVASGCL